MAYLFMFLWLIFGVIFIVTGVIWIIRRRRGKVALGSLGLSVVSLVVGVVMLSNAPAPADTSANDDGKTQRTEMIIDATKFSRLSPEDLVKELGEPKSVEEWELTGPNGVHEATTYIYNNGSFDFMIIDNMVVRFSYLEGDEPVYYVNNGELFRSFNITPGKSMKTVLDADFTKKFRSVSIDEGIAEVAAFINAEDNSISTVQITYHLGYFYE